MRNHLMVLVSALVVATGLFLFACEDPDDTDTDNSVECHELGVPFEAPEGVTRPAQLDPDVYCCDNGGLTIYEEVVDGQCVAVEPSQFVCITRDGSCDNGETFCTYPIVCEPSEDLTEPCCGEGDECWSKDADGYPPSGVKGCCSGLEEIRLVGWVASEEECEPISTETDIICVRDCGDGDCTAGESYCGCPEDCPNDYN